MPTPLFLLTALGLGHITKLLSGRRGVSQRAFASQYPHRNHRYTHTHTHTHTHKESGSQREGQRKGSRYFQPAFPPALPQPFRGVNEKRGFRERLRGAELDLVGRWGWRGGRDITLITDERGDRERRAAGKEEGEKKKKRRSGKPCVGISLPYNLPLQMWAWLLTSPYTWAKWEWATGTSQTRPMHNSWPLPWRDERKEGSNTGERGKWAPHSHPHLPLFRLAILFLDVRLLSGAEWSQTEGSTAQ